LSEFYSGDPDKWWKDQLEPGAKLLWDARRRAENVAGIVLMVLLFAACLWLVYDAFQSTTSLSQSTHDTCGNRFRQERCARGVIFKIPLAVGGVLFFIYVFYTQRRLAQRKSIEHYAITDRYFHHFFKGLPEKTQSIPITTDTYHPSHSFVTMRRAGLPIWGLNNNERARAAQVLNGVLDQRIEATRKLMRDEGMLN
jgi:hypothetical protein